MIVEPKDPLTGRMDPFDPGVRAALGLDISNPGEWTFWFCSHVLILLVDQSIRTLWAAAFAQMSFYTAFWNADDVPEHPGAQVYQENEMN